MKYVGARYMPKFVGTYDATTVYEALSVVDNGMGTSYVANKPVPAGTPLTDTEYWAVYGATSGAILNLQDQINDMQDGSISGSLQQQINTNKNNIAYIDPYEKFRNKTICVLGDSISAYEQLTNNWVKWISDFLAPYNCTVINQAENGASFAGLANDITGGTFTVETADYYILFLGTNYADSWGFTTGTYPLLPAINTVISAIRATNPDAKWFFVSPIKKFMSGMNDLLNPLAMVRAYLEKELAYNGFTVLSGYNVGELNATNTSKYMSDLVHPTVEFSPILGRYILNGLVSERSNVSSETKIIRSYTNTLTASSLIYFVYDTSDLTLKIKINANNYSANAGEWIDVCDLPTMFDSDPYPDFIYSTAAGDTRQYRNSGNKLQVYFFSAPPTNFYDVVEFSFPMTTNN